MADAFVAVVTGAEPGAPIPVQVIITATGPKSPDTARSAPATPTGSPTAPRSPTWPPHHRTPTATPPAGPWPATSEPATGTAASPAAADPPPNATSTTSPATRRPHQRQQPAGPLPNPSPPQNIHRLARPNPDRRPHRMDQPPRPHLHHHPRKTPNPHHRPTKPCPRDNHPARAGCRPPAPPSHPGISSGGQRNQFAAAMTAAPDSWLCPPRGSRGFADPSTQGGDWGHRITAAGETLEPSRGRAARTLRCPRRREV